MTTAPAPRRRSYNAGTRDTPCRSAGARDAFCMEIASLA